jgi:hypothetical protein|tara:strand:+ start:477 stop:728 length:252 start_codon:yes stop_codon:yes gene_type:complete
MIEQIVLIISQLTFSFCRTLNVRYTSRDMILPSLITSTLIKTTWIVSTYLGINAMINKDFITIVVYIIFALIGDYLSFKIKIK